MNTFWLKVAGIGIVAVVVLIVAGQFMGGDKPESTLEDAASTQNTSANVYEQDQKDHERLNAPIQAAVASAPATMNQVDTGVLEPEPATDPLPAFVTLNTEQQVEAEKLWEMAETSFKIGRKPMMTFGNCVNYCRELINRFPGSEYEIKAKRVLNDIVNMRDSYKSQYHITDEELDMGPYQ